MMPGGDLRCVPLSGLLQRGRGDDVFAVIDHERYSTYGTLGIGNNAHYYRFAQKLATETIPEDYGPIMIAIVDESGVLRMLTHEVVLDGKKHQLAVLFNASFAHNPEETSDGSYCLRLSSRLDPEGKFSERIRYTPGKNIDWVGEQEEYLLSILGA